MIFIHKANELQSMIRSQKGFLNIDTAGTTTVLLENISVPLALMPTRYVSFFETTTVAFFFLFLGSETKKKNEVLLYWVADVHPFTIF